MNSTPTQTRAVMFLRARVLDAAGERDHRAEQQEIAAQRDICTATAAQLGADVISEYAEYGGTGNLDKRPTLRQMLEELRSLRDIRYVITSGLDRLWRMRCDGEAIQFELEAAGIELVAADQPATANTAAITKRVKEVYNL